MNTNTKIILSIFCFIFSLSLVGVGLLMRKFDFSCMLRNLVEREDGLYLSIGLRFKKIADNNLEMRMNYSKRLGNYFILFSVFWFFMAVIVFWNI